MAAVPQPEVQRTDAPGNPAPAPTTVPSPAPSTPRRAGRGHITSYGEHRVCSTSGCTTQLSRYNKSPHCWAHDKPQ